MDFLLLKHQWANSYSVLKTDLKIPFCFVLTVFLLGCGSKESSKTFASQKNLVSEYKIDSLELNGFSLVVISTFIRDSVSPTSDFYSYPLYLNQKLKLYKRDTLILTKNHISERIDVRSYQGKKLSVIENRIFTIGIIDIMTDDVLFYLDGWGGCTDCSTYLELIDKNGQSILLQYGDKTTMLKNQGDLQTVQHKYKNEYERLIKSQFLRLQLNH